MDSSPAILIVRLDAIGDALTTVPLIAALQRHGLRAGAVLREANRNVFSTSALDCVHVLEQRDCMRDIRSRRYRIALVATEKPAAYRLAKDAGIPQRIGFENGWGKPLKTLWVRRMCTQTIFRTAGLDPNAPHECEVIFKLAQALIPDAQPSRDARVLRPLVIDSAPQPDSRIALQITTKWTRLGANQDDLVDLIQRIGAKHEIRMIGAAHEGDFCQSIANRIGLTVETFESLELWKNAVAAARALIAPDSGATHVAGMVGTPVIACFAERDFALQTARWSPWASAHQIVKIQAGTWPVVAADAVEALLRDRSAVYKG